MEDTDFVILALRLRRPRRRPSERLLSVSESFAEEVHVDEDDDDEEEDDDPDFSEEEDAFEGAGEGEGICLSLDRFCREK